MDQVNVILLLTLSFTYAQSQDCIGGSVYDGVNGDSVVDPGGFWYLNSNLPTTCSGDVLRYNIEYSGTGSLTVSLWSPTDNMGNYEKVQNSEFNITSPTNTFDVSDLAVRKGAIVGVYLSDSNPLQVISNVTGQSVQDAGVCVSSSDLAATEIVCSDEASLILQVNVEIDIINCGNPSGGTNNFNNGDIFPDEDREFGAVIRYSCNAGYSLIGNANRTCQADGDWTDRPMCVLVDCGSVDPPKNGEIVDSETIETTFNSVIEFICSTGYMLNGAKSITCQSDGSWSADVPTCDIINLPTSSLTFAILPTSSTGLSTQVSSSASAMSSPIPSVDSVQDDGLSASGIAAIVISALLMVVLAIVIVMIALLIWIRLHNRKKPKCNSKTVYPHQNTPSIQGSTEFSTNLLHLPPHNNEVAEMELLMSGDTINAVYTDVQEVGPIPDQYSSPDEGRCSVPDASPYEIPTEHEREIYIQLEENRVLTIPNDRVDTDNIQTKNSPAYGMIEHNTSNKKCDENIVTKMSIAYGMVENNTSNKKCDENIVTKMSIAYGMVENKPHDTSQIYEEIDTMQYEMPTDVPITSSHDVHEPLYI